jgi:hypothetical protein
MLQRTVTSAVLVFAAILTCARPAHAQQTVNQSFLAFDPDEFGGASIGGEWLVALGRFFEAGAGVSYTGQTVPSVYRDFIDSDGTEIDQDLELRIVPIAFTVRYVPFGQSTPLQPYVGGGLGVINWRYRESGEFVDFGAGRVIFEDTFEGTGTSTGPIFVGGVRFAGRRLTAGGEIRYQHAEGDLPDDFAGSKIDLGGWTYTATVGLRF